MDASWDRNWKDEVKIANVEAKLGERAQDRRKRSEEEARMRQRRGKLRLEIGVRGSPRSMGAAVAWLVGFRIRNLENKSDTLRPPKGAADRRRLRRVTAAPL